MIEGAALVPGTVTAVAAANIGHDAAAEVVAAMGTHARAAGRDDAPPDDGRSTDLRDIYRGVHPSDAPTRVVLD
ncbi:hypothetical protein, partial [Rathayibacter rathayi]|uniref:hypothetical protein n=1 Tax=Rathayibacter rathayi TaxID=33887 RepID=UPI000D3F2768